MSHTQSIDQIVISKNSCLKSHATLHTEHQQFSCLVGYGGINHKIGEGDGVTPIGCWQMSYFLYRPDKLSKPKSALPGFPIKRFDSWCDISKSKRYNQPLGFIPQTSSESLWRMDNLYNLIIVLDHNSLPFITNRGSAVFIHIKNAKTQFTQGCIALNPNDMLKLLGISRSNTTVLIKP